MRDATTVWLIRRYSGHRAEYLHEVAQMAFEWEADATRARRFKSKAEAERFGANVLASIFHAVELPLRNLVKRSDADIITGEVEDLVAF